MPLQYYASPESFNGGLCLLDEEESHHLLAVARCSVGGTVRIFDGAGRAYEAKIEAVAQKRVSCRIVRELPVAAARVRIRLCFVPVSRQSVELLLDQCTQLGVCVFQPVEAERGVSDVSKYWERKEQRWRQLLKASCKQCGRADIPQLLAPCVFSDALSRSGMALIANTQERQLPIAEGLRYIREGNPAVKEVSVFIGPEGGFSPQELALALSSGAVSVSLGPHVLRAETACAAACAALLQ